MGWRVTRIAAVSVLKKPCLFGKPDTVCSYIKIFPPFKVQGADGRISNALALSSSKNLCRKSWCHEIYKIFERKRKHFWRCYYNSRWHVFTTVWGVLWWGNLWFWQSWGTVYKDSMFYDYWIEEQHSIYVVKTLRERNIIGDLVKKELLNYLNDE